MSADKWFDQWGNFIGELPEQCVKDCTHPGPCDADTKFWKEQLDFDAPDEMARKWLRGWLDYTDEELAAFTHDLVVRYVLWLACCEIAEGDEFCGLIP